MNYSIWTVCDACDETIKVETQDLSKSYLVACPKCKVKRWEKVREETDEEAPVS